MSDIVLDTVYIITRTVGGSDDSKQLDWLMPKDSPPSVGPKFQFRVKPQPGGAAIVSEVPTSATFTPQR